MFITNKNWVEICNSLPIEYGQNWPLWLKWEKLTIQVKLHVFWLQRTKASVGVHMDKSPKICTHVEQCTHVIEHRCHGSYFYVKILPKTVFPFSVHLIATVGPCRWPIRRLYSFWLTADIIPLEPPCASRLANAFHKCTLIRLFCKVNNILNWWTIFLTDALAVI